MQQYGFGMASVKEEGTPLDPIDAIFFTGPGATKEWFKNTQIAFFNHRRKCGDSEEYLKEHPYYLPPDAQV